MTTYFKAVNTAGRSFTGNVDYGIALGTDTPVKHPAPIRGHENAANYLSVSVAAGDCTGFRWPARLFEVKPVGRAWTPHRTDLPNKRAAVAVRIVRELPAHMLFGPQGEAIVSIIEQFAKLTQAKRNALYAARGEGWYSAWDVAVDGRADRAELGAARGALDVRLVGWLDDGYTAYGAALAVLLRHTIGKDGFTQAHYEALVAPWVKVTGQKAHPEDQVF